MSFNGKYSIACLHHDYSYNLHDLDLDQVVALGSRRHGLTNTFAIGPPRPINERGLGLGFTAVLVHVEEQTGESFSGAT